MCADEDFLNCTGYSNHARDVVKEFDLSSIDGIVVVSGDGLVFEVQYTGSIHVDPFDLTGGQWINGACRLARSN